MRDLITFLDQIIFDNVIFYNIFLLISKGKSLESFISKKDKVFITGYPRSGNTYLTRLFKSLFPDIKTASHIHTVSAVKYCQKKGLKIFIVYRDIEECVSSLVLKNYSKYKKSKILIYLLMQRHIRFYKYCEKENLEIINFKDLTNKTKSVIKKISKKIGRKPPEGLDFFIKNSTNTLYVDKRNKLSATFPNKEKEIQKNLLKKLIKEI
tara:strand:- start:1115 stop:1741 length:627 start_codon:yes stop_codon:yes gene_type:complete